MTSASAAGPSSSQVVLPQSPLNEEQEGPSTFPKKNMKRKRFARLVSQDELGVAELNDFIDVSSEQRPTSPPRRVSEFDEVAPSATGLSMDSCSKDVPPLPNPLEDASMMKTHIAALRLEAELHPMRLILTRLMSHQTHNRKGIFNIPVDAEALGLVDYRRIITRPMDLGTIKRRLHAVAYQSRQQVADDIRLVFMNSMQYNPPLHPIHLAAKELLIYFEQALACLDTPELSENSEDASSSSQGAIPMEVETIASHPNTIARTVSTFEEDVSIPARVEGEGAARASVDCSGPQASVQLSQGELSLVAPASTAASAEASLPPVVALKKTSKLPPFLPHTCGTCKGRTCQMCHQGCLFHEPALMVCHGVHCEGARLRKGIDYYVSKDGNHHYCHQCYSSLTPVLPGTVEGDPCRYKQDLLKRRNDEEIAEKWLDCSKCSAGVHAICAMHNGYVHDVSDYLCLECQEKGEECADTEPMEESIHDADAYTFVSGSDVPVSVGSLGISHGKALTADSLPECAVSSFIEAKVRKIMQRTPNAEKTVTVRVVSDSSRNFAVPDVVRRHFRMATDSDKIVNPPSQVRYQQKAITLFQRIDGLDVCIFCMYVQEYDGNDDYDAGVADRVKSSHDKRVYIAYLDSVEHFRPRDCRTEVYQEILVAYLATARARGYEVAHIWACPPSRGNLFVFWNHPSSQRTPNRERLINWYHGALSRAIGCGVVTDVKSLFESEFETHLSQIKEDENSGVEASAKQGRMVCPPLLDGDFWIEEAVRVHSASLARNIKVRAPTEVCVWNVTPLSSGELDPCPALQMAALVKDRVMTHPASVPFRRPVNAAAMKLANYHEIVTKPMDLGTIHARCVIGEYDQLRQVVEDVELMVANAKRFNPAGHLVHIKADEVQALFYQELSALVKIWDASTEAKEACSSWEVYADLSMSLDTTMDIQVPCAGKSTSVLIEDDRSSDGSRSLSSSVTSVSMPNSPTSSVALSKECDVGSESKAPSAPTLEKPARRHGRGRRRGRRGSYKVNSAQPPPKKKLDLLSDGPEAVMHRMVGDDHWLLDKRNPAPSIPGAKRRRGSIDASSESSLAGDKPAAKRRRQSWVGEEVSESVRRLRTSLFTCFLFPKASMSEAEQAKLKTFEAYASEFEHSKNSLVSMSSPISDERHALLEFSQYRHLEFDTLRRAKYSTAMLLYHLKNSNAPGVVPYCSSCNSAIQEVRWHKVKKAAAKRRATKFAKAAPPEPAFEDQELCGRCHTSHSNKDEFIPIPVSLKLG